MLSFFKNKIGSILIRNERKLDQIKIQIAKNFFFNLNLNLDKILDMINENGMESLKPIHLKFLKKI